MDGNVNDTGGSSSDDGTWLQANFQTARCDQRHKRLLLRHLLLKRLRKGQSPKLKLLLHRRSLELLHPPLLLRDLLQNHNSLQKIGKDETNLMKLWSDYKDAFVEKHRVKLGLMFGFVKAAVSGLQNQPIINALIDGDDIIYRDYVDINIVVGTPKGLVVPVIHNAEKMNFADIEKEINTLAKKANDGSISIDEMTGETFTISNGGVYGILLSTPIINPPQSAILGDALYCDPSHGCWWKRCPEADDVHCSHV